MKAPNELWLGKILIDNKVWRKSKCFDTDIKYIRADKVGKLQNESYKSGVELEHKMNEEEADIANELIQELINAMLFWTLEGVDSPCAKLIAKAKDLIKKQ